MTGDGRPNGIMTAEEHLIHFRYKVNAVGWK